MITLAEVSALSQALIEADKQVDDAEQKWKEAKARARALREESIPCALQELGLSEIRLSTGESISIKQDVVTQIPAEQKERAYAWLEEHGHGGLIKTEVGVRFGKAGLDSAKHLAQQLIDLGFEPTITRDVHYQTLTAFLREQLSKPSTDVPLDVFHATPIWTTKITPPKRT